MWFLYIFTASFFWALLNVLDSFLVRRHEHHPMVIMWCQSLLSIVVLTLIAMFFPLHSSWWWILLLCGALAYVGDLLFFYILDWLDVSVMNAAWAILSVLLSIGGFIFFRERWTFLQVSGAVGVIGGVFFLSYWHQHVSLSRTIVLLSGLALLYLPFYLFQKAALLDQQAHLSVFFWSIVSREILAVTIPFVIPSVRKRIGARLQSGSWMFFVYCALVIACFLVASYLNVIAYDAGPLSLVSISSNVQPFLVIFLAWLVWRFFPRVAPRELLTKQSVGIKLFSFSLVFLAKHSPFPKYQHQVYGFSEPKT